MLIYVTHKLNQKFCQCWSSLCKTTASWQISGVFWALFFKPVSNTSTFLKPFHLKKLQTRKKIQTNPQSYKLFNLALELISVGALQESLQYNFYYKFIASKYFRDHPWRWWTAFQAKMQTHTFRKKNPKKIPVCKPNRKVLFPYKRWKSESTHH